MPLTILVTGFGPFPGVPFNPTSAIVMRLARLRWPALSGVKLIGHVFPTSYTAVDRELPSLISRYRPQALLMFGVAARARTIRVETRARNATALSPGVDGMSVAGHAIAPGKPAAIALRTPLRPLLAAFRGTSPASASTDAGRYVCNYLCWRAGELSSLSANGPRCVAFIHVPMVRRSATRRSPLRKGRKSPGKRKPLPSMDNLVAAASRALLAIAAEARR